MKKATKRERDDHDRTMQLIHSDNPLSDDEIEFILSHFDPRCMGNVNWNQAFFTPERMAHELAVSVGGLKEGSVVVDLCAGIGQLAYTFKKFNRPSQLEIHAVEYNPEYVEVGRRILPGVIWHQGDMRDQRLWQEIPEPKWVVTNPPYGNLIGSYVEESHEWLNYRGIGALQAIEIGLRVARIGVGAILPCNAVPIRYSWDEYPHYQWPNRGPLNQFMKMYPHTAWCAMGHDTSKFSWKGTNVKTEIVTCYWDGPYHELRQFKDLGKPIIPEISLEF